MRNYRNMMARMGGALLLAGAFVIAAPAQADAAFYAWICDDAACMGGGDFVVQDQTASDLGASGLVPGFIQFSNVNVGGLTITGNTSISNSLNGINPLLNLEYSAQCILGCQGGTAWVFASDTGFTSGGISATFNGTAGIQQEGSVYGGNVNTNTVGALPSPDLSNLLGTSGLVVGAPFDVSIALGAPTAFPYALTAGVQIILNAGSTASGDLSIVPEPASMALFGLGLFGFGLASRRRMRKA